MLLAVLVASLLVAPSATSTRATDPHALVDRAIAAMQRTTSLRDTRALRLTGIQHEFMFGNAERAEGPWRVFYSQFTELRDPASDAFRRTDRTITPTGTMSPERVTVLADSVIANRSGTREVGSSHAAYEDAIDRVDASPDRALLLAAASKALALDGKVTRFSITFDVVSFPWRNGRMKIEISRESHLPNAVEIVREYPDNFRWAPFGLVTMRADYVDWTVQPSGAYWPMQQKISLNGEPIRDITLASVSAESAAAAPDSFAVSDSARAQYVANSKLNFSKFRFGARGQPTELKPGIVRVPDQWVMTLVKQADGVVIFESHISGQYLHEVIDEAHRRWPGAPIKAMVLSSDPWAHLGGFGEAVKLGIPIYVNARSVPFLAKLARNANPKFVPVSGKTVIGTGDNAIELYPVGGPYAERMTMAYFPHYRLLYGADLVFQNRGPDGKPTTGFLTTEVTDLRAAVEREKLAVDSLFCVQNYGPFIWSDFIAK
ncbi:MAG: hypothetical protein ABJE47_17980 [bacterium]